MFGRDAATPWVERIVGLAVERNLWLHAHCDDAALEILHAHNPRVKIIWAHSGFSTPPAKIAEYLARHPDLVGELSYRYDMTEDGRLTPAWRALLLAHPDRFVVGSDTWVNERWATLRGNPGLLPRLARAAAAGRGGEDRLGQRRAPVPGGNGTLSVTDGPPPAQPRARLGRGVRRCRRGVGGCRAALARTGVPRAGDPVPAGQGGGCSLVRFRHAAFQRSAGDGIARRRAAGIRCSEDIRAGDRC